MKACLLRYSYCTHSRNPSTSELNAFASRIRRCAATSEGKTIEAELSSSGCCRSTYLANLLVAMYGRLSSLSQAKKVFDGITDRNVFSWTMLLSAYAQNGHCQEAIELYFRMHQEGSPPDAFILSSVITACSSIGSLAAGKAIHDGVRLERSLIGDTVVRNSLVNMYAKCGSLDDANRIFDEIQTPDVISWNSIIAAHVQNGESAEAIVLFRRMQSEGFKPQLPTLSSVFDAFADKGAYDQGRRLHETVVACGLRPDVMLGNSLIALYGKCRKVAEARNVLELMPCRDVVSWTVMAAMYTQNGQYSEALKLLQVMDLEGGKPDAVTFVSLLECCANLLDLPTGRYLHARISLEGGGSAEDLLSDCLVNMYGKCGSLEEAKLVFDRSVERSVSSCNSMMGALVTSGNGGEALDLFRRMDLEGTKADKLSFYAAFEACVVSFRGVEQARALEQSAAIEGETVGFESAVVSLYSRVGSFGDAMRKFESMVVRDVISWNGIIAACNRHSRWSSSVEFFRKMELEGFKADEVTLVSVLEACSSLEDFRLGEAIHERIVSGGFEIDAVLGSHVIDMYGRCGELERARLVFEGMRQRGVVAWTAMITANAQNERGTEALALFRRMDVEGVRADEVTLSLVLDVCGDDSALSQARVFLASFIDRDLVVDNTLVNMYGKCGRVDEAWCVFRTMKMRDVVSWTSMIAAFSQQGLACEAFELFREMQQAGEGGGVDTVVFVKLMGGCSHAGMLELVIECFCWMVGDFGVLPVNQNYACVLDVLGRVGEMAEALRLLEAMPVEPDSVAWMSFLNACKVHKDVRLGDLAAERLMQIDPNCSASHVLLSGIHADA